jgi:beta-galactosidase
MDSSSLSLSRRDLLRSSLALSATTLVVGSVRRAHALLAAYPGAASVEALSAVAPRERLLFDFGWKFFQGHGNDPRRDLDFGTGQGDFAKSGEFKFATEKFDDSKWRALNLPHDWAVELPFVRDEEQQSHGYKPLGRRYPETRVGTGVPSIFRRKTADAASRLSLTVPFAARRYF